MKNSIISLLTMAIIPLSSVYSIEDKSCQVTKNPPYELESTYRIEVPGTSYPRDYSTTIDIKNEGFLTDIFIGNKRFQFSEIIDLKEDDKVFQAKMKDKKNELLLKLYKNSQLGVVLVKSKQKFQVLSTFDCNDYSESIKKLKSSKFKDFKKISEKDIPASVIKLMSEVDVPFEMGDGYYDLLKEDIYVLKSKAGKILGYRVESELSYTEGPENEYSTDIYLSNGIRVDSSMW